MITICAKNETNNTYDTIRKALMETLRGSKGYIDNQIRIRNNRRSENVLVIELGESKDTDIILNCNLASVVQMVRTVQALSDDSSALTSKGETNA